MLKVNSNLHVFSLAGNSIVEKRIYLISSIDDQGKFIPQDKAEKMLLNSLSDEEANGAKIVCGIKGTIEANGSTFLQFKKPVRIHDEK